MTLQVHISSITMSDGTEVRASVGGTVVLVGPNNAGKSAAIREITQMLTNPTMVGSPTRVVTDLQVEKTGDQNDLEAWLAEHARSTADSQGTPIRLRLGHSASLAQLRALWDAGPPFQILSHFFHTALTSQERLQMVNSTQSFDLLRTQPTAPLQILFAEPELESELAEVCREAFGVGVVLNRISGDAIHLHLGEPPETTQSIPPSHEYVEHFRRLPLVQDQGDGMKSFIGIMLTLISARFPIVLVDEPEAFLHPPQARLLGRRLASLPPSDTQVFVATHSNDVLQGLLEAKSGNVTVVRVTRLGDSNPTTILEPDPVRDLWGDSLLRYSNVLAGLFHKGVVVCESDSDCRFYAACLDYELESKSEPASDVLFTHCGGYARIPTAVKALHAVNVPVRVVADFDVLKDVAKVREIVEALGASWTPFEADWRIVNAHITNSEQNPSREYVREKFLERLDASGTTTLLPRETADLKGLLRLESGWSAAKKTGMTGVPAGDATSAASRLLEGLRSLGVFVVPVGELESWAREIPNHGPEWVGDALERGLHRRESSACRDFIVAVHRSFA